MPATPLILIGNPNAPPNPYHPANTAALTSSAGPDLWDWSPFQLTDYHVDMDSGPEASTITIGGAIVAGVED